MTDLKKRCLSGGVISCQYILDFKNVWIQSGRAGEDPHFSKMSKNQKHLNHLGGGGQSLLGHSPKFNIFFCLPKNYNSASQTNLNMVAFFVCIMEKTTGNYSLFVWCSYTNNKHVFGTITILSFQLSVFGGWYQPIGAGGTRSPRRTASKIQNGHWGPENDRRGLQRCPPNGCWMLLSTFAK